jgi:hypothetical protein
VKLFAIEQASKIMMSGWRGIGCENRAPVRIRTGAEGLNETDTTTEGANKNDDLAHTNSVTGSAFAIANNSWQNFYWLKADKNVAKTWRAVC